MDPIGAIGAVASVIQIVTAVTRLAKNLNEVRESYNNVALNITLVASQLNSIRAALEAIADWRTTTQDTSRTSQQLDEDLAISLNCCAILVTVIDSKLGEAGYTPGMKQKIRHLWLEDVLKEYLSNLEGQVRSLQLLLTIFQCRTTSEQRQKLEQEESRTVMEQLRAETASLHIDSDAVSNFSLDPSINLENRIHRRPERTKPVSDTKAAAASTVIQKLPESSSETVILEKSPSHTASRKEDRDRKTATLGGEKDSLPPNDINVDSMHGSKGSEDFSERRGRSASATSAQVMRKASENDKSGPPRAVRGAPQLLLDLGLEKDLGLVITSEGLSRASFDSADIDRQGDIIPAASEDANEGNNQLAAVTTEGVNALLPGEALKEDVLPAQVIESPAKKPQRPRSCDTDLYDASIRAPSIIDAREPASDERLSNDKPTNEKISNPFEDDATNSSSNAEPSKEDLKASLSGPFQWHLDKLDNSTTKLCVPPDHHQLSSNQAPPLPKRAAPPVPQLSLDVVVSNSDEAATRSDDNSVPTTSDGTASLEYRHRQSMSSIDESSLGWSERVYSHSSASVSPETLAPPISPREQAQMKLQGLQLQLAEAKAKGDSKGARQALEKSIEIIHQNYLPDASSRSLTTWPPIRKSHSRGSLLRLPSLTHLVNRARKPQVQALFNAVRCDDIPTIKDYLSQGLSVNVRSEDFETPLMQAAIHGKLQSMDILRQSGADEFAVNGKGQTVLHIALATKQMYAVQWLLKNYRCDETSNAQPKSWRLARSSSTLTTRSPKCLREASDKEGSRPLHVAASQNLTELLVVLITDGAIIEARNNWGGTPLHVAIFTNSLNAASALLAKSAKVDVVDINGMSPLHWAANLGHLEAVNLLLKAGAQQSFSGSGDLPIHFAIRQGHLNVVENFMFHGADVETKTQRGDTLLLVAAVANQTKIAEFLLLHSANANPFSRLMPVKLGSNGIIATKEFNSRSQPPLTTPLHFACFAGWYELAALLLDHQALVNVPDGDGKTPIILATEADDTNLVYLLIARGAKVNATIPGNMQTAAHIASMKGNLETMQKLYQSGANIHARASDMRSPEEYVSRCSDAQKHKALRQWYAEMRNLRIAKARQNQQQREQTGSSSLEVQNHPVNSPPAQNELALIQQLSPPGQYFDPENDSFPEAPPPYVAGPSAPTRLTNRAGVYRPPGSS